jgi:hypothetical protein
MAKKKPYADHVKKEATPTQVAYTEWLTKNTGYAVDAESVKLAMRLASTFRTSPERVAVKDAKKAALAAHRAEVEQRRNERNEKRAAALEAKAAAIREGKVRGPGRPPKEREVAAQAAPVDESPDVEVIESEDGFSADAEVIVVNDDDDDDFGDDDDDSDSDDDSFSDDDDDF